jgi:tripartite-type tricarboxylate transporter receptor subunit TctC
MLGRLQRCAVIGVLLATPSLAGAEPFPGRSVVRIVVPTGPGAPPDVLSRIIANELSESEGWRVIADNHPGALQTIAIGEVLKQPADGLTVFPMSTGAVAVPSLMPYKGLRLDTDFAPVVDIASGYLVLVVHPSVQAASVSELVSLIRSRPAQFNVSSGGFGTPAHLAAEMFRLRTGTSATHVPYPQSQQRLADLLAGSTQFAFYNTIAVLDYIATGKLRALAVTAPRRLAALPDVPTMGEQGFPDVLIADWQGFVVKAGSPPEAIAALNAAVNRALAKPKIREALGRIGYEPIGGTPAEFGAMILSQISHWGGIVRDSGITVQR